MIYTALTRKAMRICIKAHENQVDQSGMPYLLHPFHVAEQMTDEYETCTALLHDVVEDSDISCDDLRAMGMPEEVVTAVDLLTKRKGVPYLAYIKHLKDNRLARTVKLADLAHNSELGRLDEVTIVDLERQKKYIKAKEILMESGYVSNVQEKGKE